jgi:hypothetical protein
MYKRIILSTSLLIFSFLPAKATQITLSNNPDSPGQYTTPSSAITNAAPGDTILVQPSAQSYGDMFVSKEITLIGPGHHPNTTLGLKAIFGTITLETFSSGSVFEGLQIGAVGTASAYQDIVISNVFFRNNLISSVWFFNTANNVVFEGNVFNNSISFNGNPLSQAVFRNNLFLGDFGGGSGNFISGVASPIIVDHNNFISSCLACTPFNGVNGAIITNNIFQYMDTQSIGVNNCTFTNNLTYLCNAEYPAGNNSGSGNINNADPLFVNYPDLPEIFDWSYDLHTEPASPATNAATDGTDLGMYGNNFNFLLSGEPWGVPVITSIGLSTNAVPQGGVIQVNFSAQTGQ